MVTAVIVAAGKSRRMGQDKILAPLGGVPVLAHALSAFDRCDEIDAIILVGAEERLGEFRALCHQHAFAKVCKFVAGGCDRHHSVWHGLREMEPVTEFVAIHDGARPLTTSEMISGCLALARESGAACCATQIPDTVKRANETGEVTESVERSGLWAMQTPQIFRAGIILHAYRVLMEANLAVTDEVSAVQRLGRTVRLYSTSDWNFKITLPKDLAMAEQIIAARAASNSVPEIRGGRVAGK